MYSGLAWYCWSTPRVSAMAADLPDLDSGDLERFGFGEGGRDRQGRQEISRERLCITHTVSH